MKIRYTKRVTYLHADLSRGTSSTLKKVMRGANRGEFIPDVPTEKAKLRHAWYRRKLAMGALRAMAAE